MGGVQPLRDAHIAGEEITLEKLLKWTGVAATGGQAKLMVQAGMVTVNDAVETRRSRKLRNGDIVRLNDNADPIRIVTCQEDEGK